MPNPSFKELLFQGWKALEQICTFEKSPVSKSDTITAMNFSESSGILSSGSHYYKSSDGQTFLKEAVISRF